MNILLWSLIFVASLALLSFSADKFTDNSEKLGLSLGIPQFIIGISIVALGTSLPELITSVYSNITGVSSLVASNVVGSNIANTLLVMGVAAMWVRKIKVEKNLIKLDLPILVAVTAILIMSLLDGVFTIFEAIVMLLTYVVYLSYNFSEHRRSMVEKAEEAIDKVVHPKKRDLEPTVLLYIFLAAIGIFIGAKFTVDAITQISTVLKIPVSIISITALAIGTSLPELVVGIMAARKGNFEMVIGNVLGSNIFNATLVMAVPTFLGPLNVTQDVITVAIPFLIIATLLLTFSGIERKVFSYEGALYCILYVVFMGQLFSTL